MRHLRRLAGYLRPYAAGLAAALLLLAGAGALASAGVALLEPLVNEVLLQRSGESAAGAKLAGALSSIGPLEEAGRWVRRQSLVRIPLLVVAVFLARGVLLFLGQYAVTRAGVLVLRDLRAALFEAVVRQPLQFFHVHPTGHLMSRILGDVARLQRVSTVVLADLVRVGAMVPFLVAVVLWADWRTAVVSSAVLPLLVWPMLRLGRRLRRASTRSQESMAAVSGALNESISGVKVVQGFGMEGFESRRFRGVLGEMVSADLRAGRAAALAPAALEIVGGVAAAGLFVLAGWRIGAGRLDPGQFAVVLSGLGLLYLSLKRLNALYVEIQQGLAAASRVFGVMDRRPEIADLPGAGPLGSFDGEIRFESVEFAYLEEPVLRGLDLVLRRGEIVALVGPSGAGKSTVAHLLPRFFDPTAGRITVDGRDLRAITLASLRGAIALVTQETVLFDDTVHRNIAYGLDGVPRSRVEQAARAAHAHEFVAALPDGYDTRLGERGVRLSMGQRQRIAIARALLKDAPILVLDEATSALDAESEALVQQALERLIEGRTCLVIAHRLATVRRADRIIVLEGGRVTQEGSHEELMAADGPYARLCRLQFESRDSSESRP